MFIYQKRLDMKIFFASNESFQENWQQKGRQRLELNLLIHPQRWQFSIDGVGTPTCHQFSSISE